jgi:regulatory protein
VRARLSDGSSFLVHGELVVKEDIRVERGLSPAEVASLQSRSESIFARHSALSLLSRSPHSRKGLSQKLRARGFGADAVSAALRRMEELGYLDDRAYAENWLRTRMELRREGWMALYKGLIQRGVPRPIADETLSRMCTDEVELEIARGLVKGESPRKAAARLKARGFRSRAIGKVLRELDGRAPADEGD